jgi:type IV pilus assembly protein PilY1
VRDVPPQSPAPLTEAQVASSGYVRWEFTDENLGYVFDAPTLVKTYARGWVVLVASGYNNKDGKGYLYVLNPGAASTSGELLAKIALPGDTGTAASPTGLSTIRAYTASRRNPYVLQAYGGDLKGNVWRFDLTDPDPANWNAKKIAVLTDPDGRAQPVTTGVRIEIDQSNNVDRYLFVGTGRLLDQADLTVTATTPVSTMYVIKDGNVTTPDATLATRPVTRANLNRVDATKTAGFGEPGANTRGWYQDATDKTQKIITDVYPDVQIAVFAFSYPSTDPCLSALRAKLYARAYSTGESALVSGDNGGPSVDISGGIAGSAVVQGAPSASSAGTIAVQVTTLSGQVVSIPVKQPVGATTPRHRISWRLLNGD